MTFDELSARMKSTKRGVFELFELKKSKKSGKSEKAEKLRTEYLKEHFRHFLIELFRQYAEVNIKWSQTQLCTIRRPVA